MEAPRWSLRHVKKLAASGSFVVLQRRAADFFDTMQEARASVAKMIAALSALGFAHTVATQADEADVYGPMLAERQWYLKLTIQPVARLIVISMHPAERSLETTRDRQARKARLRR